MHPNVSARVHRVALIDADVVTRGRGKKNEQLEEHLNCVHTHTHTRIHENIRLGIKDESDERSVLPIVSRMLGQRHFV